MAKALPPEVLAFFRRHGARGGTRGGSIGGKKAAAGMSADARIARARRAGLASAAVRCAKAKSKKRHEKA